MLHNMARKSRKTNTLSRLIPRSVIPAKAGIQNHGHLGFRIKCGMTTHLIDVDKLPGCAVITVYCYCAPGMKKPEPSDLGLRPRTGDLSRWGQQHSPKLQKTGHAGVKKAINPPSFRRINPVALKANIRQEIEFDSVRRTVPDCFCCAIVLRSACYDTKRFFEGLAGGGVARPSWPCYHGLEARAT